jgi:hypothetical protein
LRGGEFKENTRWAFEEAELWELRNRRWRD